MTKVTVSNDVKIHCQQIGDGPDLVMIHGLTGNLAVWHLKIVPMLWDRFRILTYDLRGHGYSDVPAQGYSADAMAGDLLELLDALDIERASVVGHSFGGDVALYFAYHHPERVDAVVAIEAAVPAMMHLRARDDWQGWEYWTDVLERSGKRVPPERRADAGYLLRASLSLPKKWGPLRGLPRNPKPFLRLVEETSLTADFEEVGALTLDRIPDIRVPVFLMYTERSAFIETHDHLLEHLPDAHSILLPRTEWGHFGPLEQPDVVGEHIRSSLLEHAGDR